MPKILVAEINPEIRSTIGRILERSGYDLEWAYSLRDAQGVLAEDECDLVIANIDLEGGTSGLDLWNQFQPCGELPPGALLDSYWSSLPIARRATPPGAANRRAGWCENSSSQRSANPAPGWQGWLLPGRGWNVHGLQVRPARPIDNQQFVVFESHLISIFFDVPLAWLPSAMF